MSEKYKEVIASLILIGALIVSHFFRFDLTILIRFLALFSVLFHAYILGKRLFPRSGLVARTSFASILFVALLSIGLTIAFYANLSLSNETIFWMMVVTMGLCDAIALMVRIPSEQEPPTDTVAWTPRRATITAAFLILSLALATFVLWGAFHAATVNSIRTPWPLLSHGTLVALAVLWIVIPLSTWLVQSRLVTAVQFGLAIFSTTAIAPLVYRLGFGFDGFLHIAGEKILLATGTLNPKPFYYIGQYVFTTLLARISDIPIEQFDRWLVPVSAALLLPFAAYLSRRVVSSPIGFVLLPLAPFIATTPQSFAYVLGISALLLALETSDAVHPLAPLILAGWSVATHPLAGIPFLFVTLAVLVQARWIQTGRRALVWLCAVLAATSVPFLFYVLGRSGTTDIIWNIQSLLTLTSWKGILVSLTPWLQNAFVVWPAWASLIARALPAMGILGAVGTIVIGTRRRIGSILLASGILLLLAGAVLKTAGDFAFLIDYERGNYAERLVTLAIFALVVGSLPSIHALLERARRQNFFVMLVLLVGVSAIAAAQSYNALPRHDALVTGRGWSVGIADIMAVREIDRDAKQEPYTVLANQSVSAAAVLQFGFKRYNGDIFFYPIPTGGALYETYLRMVYQAPSRDTAVEAGKLGGTRLVYVVLNDYWWKADEIAESLTEIADATWVIGEPEKGPDTSVRVYRFELHK